MRSSFTKDHDRSRCVGDQLNEQKMTSLLRPLFSSKQGQHRSAAVVAIEGSVVVTMPNRNSNSAVMVVAMTTDSDASSSDPNGDSCSVGGRRHYRQCQAESCEGGE